ncbi:dihydroorotase [Candidatus Omnitrophota bacterium]
MKLLIKNGHVVDPANKIDKVCDILVKGAVISTVADNISEKTDKVIDAKGKIVLPGIVDMHVHLREPGREDQETIASGTTAALKGGVTSVVAMPNTGVPIDSVEMIKLLSSIIKKDAKVNVCIAGAITEGRLGRKLAEIAKFSKEDVVAITDDGSSVDSEDLFSEALQEAKKAKLLIIDHCEDISLSKKGVVNHGLVSTVMGVKGISGESEYKRIERDIQLAQKTKGTLHIAHVSCKESVEIIAKAKKKGVNVTAETAPHYFALHDELVIGYNTNLKINPPLRTRADMTAILQGLKDGTIDCIASDHAPHTRAEKDRVFDIAPFGTIGLETMLSVAITELIEKKILSWPQLVEKLCLNPAGALQIKKGTLAKGADADIVIVDPKKKWKVSADSFASLSRNSAFIGHTLVGVVEYTICSGKVSSFSQ